jgi:hypothetical protein
MYTFEHQLLYISQTSVHVYLAAADVNYLVGLMHIFKFRTYSHCVCYICNDVAAL